eukprot:986263_1
MLTSFLLTILSVTVSADFGCGTDDHIHHIVQNMNIKPKTMNKHSILEGRAQDPQNISVPFEKIRISYDTSQLESDWANYDKLSYFRDDVIPAAYEWLMKVFSVMPVDGPLTFDVCNKDSGTTWDGGSNDGKCKTPVTNWQTCGETGVIIPRFMFDEEEICTTASGACDTSQYPQGSGMADTDLMIYFTGSAAKDNTDECGGVMGFAGPCHSNSRNRPIAGYVNLCKLTIDSAKVLTWEESIALIIHETFHVLGFIDNAFEGKFIHADGTPRTDVLSTKTKRGIPRVLITLPTVLEKAKEFFNCDDIDGIELENYNKNG